MGTAAVIGTEHVRLILATPILSRPLPRALPGTHMRTLSSAMTVRREARARGTDRGASRKATLLGETDDILLGATSH